jgi:hypothetical protein
MDQPVKGLPTLGVFLAAGMIASAVIASQAFYKVKLLDNTLAVTGSARQRVTSDAVKWTSSFSRVVPLADVKAGYAQMKKDEAAVKAFLSAKGIKDDAVTISPVFMSENYKQNDLSPREFTLRQTVEVRSSDVDGLTALAKDLTPIIDQGVLFSSDGLEYTYSKLPDLRVNLLSDAVKDAQARAAKIAESTGKAVGPVRSASAGVVQVLPVGSTDVSDYGSYDTQDIEKEVMVTVKATFAVQ